MFMLEDEMFVYDEDAERLLKVRAEFAERVLTGAESEGQSIASLLGLASKDG